MYFYELSLVFSYLIAINISSAYGYIYIYRLIKRFL